ncbi:MAG TPA: hypothetical protein VIM14_17035 [Polyangia bacterium]
MFHRIGNMGRVMLGKPTKERPPKARWVDIFAEPGGDMAENARLNEEAKEKEGKSSS